MNEIQVLKSIFLRASELKVPERAAFLDSACHGNTPLRIEVERMLVQFDNDDRLLEPITRLESVSAAETVRQQTVQDAQSALSPGTVIASRFELVEMLGEGGMGVVWQARQCEPVNRTVAIKFVKIPVGVSGSAQQILERFERERHALSALDHPYIARVIDGGQSESGTPYVVMEFVNGLPITEYCQTRHLNLRSRLQLFLKVCDAVRHAHQKGIIHRDLKPGNILVAERDSQSEPKIIDFGLAKSLQDDSMALATGLGLSVNMIVGTPLYMPPERVVSPSRIADVRDDVYSLGVLLYELLTGHLPISAQQLDGLNWEQMIQLFREHCPTAPSQRILAFSTKQPSEKTIIRATEVRGELDWIALTALASERERRYRSVDALTSDLSAYLNGEPIAAAPPSRWYQIRKLISKHRYAVAATSMVLACLLVGIAATTSTMFWALREKQRAEQAELLAQQQLTRSLEIKSLVTKMFEGVTPQRAQGKDVTLVRDILDDTANRLEHGEIEDEQILVEIHRLIGDVYRQLGIFDSAEKHLSAARELSYRVHGSDHDETLNTRAKLAHVYYRQGRFSEAIELYRSTWIDSCRELGDEHPNTLSLLNNMASVHFDQGHYDQSEPLFLRALTIQTDSLGPDHADTLRTKSNLAALYRNMDQLALAEQLFLEVREAKERTLSMRHPSTLNTLNGLANLYADQERRAEAEALYRTCLELSQEVLGSDHPGTLMAHGNLALLLKEKGELSEAESLYRTLLNVKTNSASLGPEHPSTLHTMNNLGILLAESGRTNDAETMYQTTLAARKRVLSNDHPDTLATMNNLAVLLENENRWTEAEQLHLEVLTAKRSSLGLTHRDTELTMLNLGNLYLAMDRVAEAEEYFQAVLDQNIEKNRIESAGYLRAQQGIEKVRQKKTTDEN